MVAEAQQITVGPLVEYPGMTYRYYAHCKACDVKEVMPNGVASETFAAAHGTHEIELIHDVKKYKAERDDEDIKNGRANYSVR